MPGFGRCMVWYWDDISKADTSYPVDPDKEETLIATYVFDFLEFKSTLKVFTLGDEEVTGSEKMKKIFAFLATVLLLGACSNPAPTSYIEIEHCRRSASITRSWRAPRAHSWSW